jgi:hypothetical protein
LSALLGLKNNSDSKEVDKFTKILRKNLTNDGTLIQKLVKNDICVKFFQLPFSPPRLATIFGKGI